MGVQGIDTQTQLSRSLLLSCRIRLPWWARSTYAPKMNRALHDCCRIISGCLKPTNLDSVHLLAGIAPPHIRRTVACRMERTRQTTDDRHQLFHHQPAASRLKSGGFLVARNPPPRDHVFFIQGSDTVTGTDSHQPFTFATLGNPP